MQQAYQGLQVILQTQTVHIVISPHPDELMLKELLRACTGLQSGDLRGIKAIILDFKPGNESASAVSPGGELLTEAPLYGADFSPDERVKGRRVPLLPRVLLLSLCVAR